MLIEMERLRGVNTGIKVIALSFIVSISSCLNDFDYSKVPVYSKTGNVNCVIEIPAGTNHKIEKYIVTKEKEKCRQQRNYIN